ncbi:MAG: response regulator transcription factor [Coriobacteriales bacterium]
MSDDSRATEPGMCPEASEGAGCDERAPHAGDPRDAGKIKVLVVDDHPLVRRGVRSLLAGSEDVEVVGEAGNLASARARLLELAPDMVILDVRLGGESGLGILPSLAQRRGGARVLVLSSYVNESVVRECVSLGVAGYLVKDTEGLDLASAVRVVAGGGTVFDPRVISIAQRPGALGAEALSPREEQVLGFVCQGLSNLEIASELGISENTVKGYVSGVMRKLGCDNRVRLVLKAKELGIA